MEVIANCSYSEGRIRDFYRFHLTKRSPERYFYAVLAVFSAGIGIFFLTLGNFEMMLFMMLLGILILVIRIVLLNYTLNRILKKRAFPSGKYLLKIHEFGITYQGGNVVRKFVWNDLKEVCQTDNYIYFYTGPNSALILVLYQISKEEMELVRKLILNGKSKYYFYKFK